MERQKIKLTNEQWQELVQEQYLEINNEQVDIIETTYEDSGRHTEHWNLIFKIESTRKYFRVNYEVSVKDSMGWDECNYGDTDAIEVFPEVINETVYK